MGEKELGAGRRWFVRRITKVLTASAGVVAISGLRPASASAADSGSGLTRATGTANWIGEIVLVPYNFAPRGFAFCEVQELPISQNQSLYALIGNLYG